jgi:hypothetical protein
MYTPSPNRQRSKNKEEAEKILYYPVDAEEEESS